MSPSVAAQCGGARYPSSGVLVSGAVVSVFSLSGRPILCYGGEKVGHSSSIYYSLYIYMFVRTLYMMFNVID